MSHHPLFSAQYCLPEFVSSSLCSRYYDSFGKKYQHLFASTSGRDRATTRIRRREATTSGVGISTNTSSHTEVLTSHRTEVPTAAEEEFYWETATPATSSSGSSAHTIGVTASFFPISGERTTRLYHSSERENSTTTQREEATTSASSFISSTEPTNLAVSKGASEKTTSYKDSTADDQCAVSEKRASRKVRKLEQHQVLLRESLDKLRTRERTLSGELRHARRGVDWLLGLTDQMGSDLDDCMGKVAEKDEAIRLARKKILEESDPGKEVEGGPRLLILSVSLFLWLFLSVFGLLSLFRLNYASRGRYNIMRSA